MKKLFTPALSLIIFTTMANAQDQVIKINVIKDKELLQRSVYTYPAFTAGTVHLKNNSTENARLNYNRLNDEMLFIGNKNDTLALSEPETVENIVIGKDVYFYISGVYVMQLTAYQQVNLEVKSRLKYIGIEKKADGYGSSYSNASSNESYTNVKNGTAPRIDADVNQTYVLSNAYYLYNGKMMMPAGKKAFGRFFPKHDKEIGDYIASQHISFEKQADLEKLLQYAVSLQ